MNGDGLASSVLAWLLSYAIHSTILLGSALLLTRRRALHPATADVLWKSALLGGVLTATIQSQLDFRPAATISLAAKASTPPVRTQSPLIERNSPSNDAGEVAPNASPGAANAADVATPVTFSNVLVLGWAAFALVLGLTYAARRLILVGRLGDRQPLGDAPMQGAMRALLEDAGHRRRIHLTTSRSISSPVALGFGEICLPTAALTDLDGEQQRSMLAHELAHIARRDPLWLDCASLLERVFFFQPLNRVARRELQANAEYLCDEWAAERTGSGVPLARCLAKVAESIQASPLGVPVAGMAEQRSLLVTRIARLLERPATIAPRRRGAILMMAAFICVAMVAVAPRVSGRALIAPTVGGSDISGAQLTSPSIDAAADGPAQTGSVADPSPDSSARPEANGRVVTGPEGEDTTIVLALIARLRDDDAQVRRAAASSLGNLEDARAIPGLISTLKDADAEVRAAAADALGNFEDPRAIAPLADLLGDSNPDVKRSALNALSSFDKGVPSGPVIRLLDDSDPQVRHQAAHLLARLGDRSAIGALSKLVRDPSADVRTSAVGALGELGDPAVAPTVAAALGDPDADVRQSALSALDELKVPIPEATLLALLRDSSADVRSTASQLAGNRSIVVAIPSLKRMLEDVSAQVRESAIDALSEIVDPSAREALRSALNSADAKVRRRAAEALGERN